MWMVRISQTGEKGTGPLDDTRRATYQLRGGSDNISLHGVQAWDFPEEFFIDDDEGLPKEILVTFMDRKVVQETRQTLGDDRSSTEPAVMFRKMIEAVEWPEDSVVEVHLRINSESKTYEFSNGPEGQLERVLDV